MKQVKMFKNFISNNDKQKEKKIGFIPFIKECSIPKKRNIGRIIFK